MTLTLISRHIPSRRQTLVLIGVMKSAMKPKASRKTMLKRQQRHSMKLKWNIVSVKIRVIFWDLYRSTIDHFYTTCIREEKIMKSTFILFLLAMIYSISISGVTYAQDANQVMTPL